MSYILEDVKAIPIVEVFQRLGHNVSEKARPHGDWLKILCPFHKDEDPSCSLNVAENWFHCFGCQAGGSNLDAVIESGQATDPGGAIKWLGDAFNRPDAPPGTTPPRYDREAEKLKAYKAYRAATDAGKGASKSGIGPEADYRDAKSLDLHRSLTIGSPYGLHNFILDLQTEPEGLKFGFKGDDGEKLDKALRLEPGTVNIIAGRPGHGKTTFMLNAMANMVAAYPWNAFMYLTYEEAQKGLAFRVVRVLAAEKAPPDNPSSNISKGLMRELALRFETSSAADTTRIVSQAKAPGYDHGFPPNVWDALKEFNKLTAEDSDKGARIFLLDAHRYAGDTVLDLTELDQLFRIIRSHCESSSMHPIGAVFLDYAQKIPPPSRGDSRARASTRQQELQDVNDRLVQFAKRENIPVVIGAQFNREVRRYEDVNNDRLREAGDFEQDATTVIGLWHGILADHERAGADGKLRGKTKSYDAPEPRGDCPLGVKVLKNRNGPKPNLYFTFNVSTGYIVGENCTGGNSDSQGGNRGTGFDDI